MNLLLNCLKQPLNNHLLNIRCLSYANYNPGPQIKEIIEKHTENKEAPDYDSLRREILAVDRKATETTLDFLILNNCQSGSTRNFAINYVKHLEQNGKELNLAATSRLLKIYGTIQDNKECTSKNEEIESEIIKIYEKIIQKYQVLDISLTESVILALCTTKQWKTSLELFEKLQTSSNPTTTSSNILISTLFLHNEEETAWKMLQEMVDLEKSPGDRCYISYLSMITNSDSKDAILQKTEKLFEFWSNNDILISEDMAAYLVNFFKTYQKKAALATINTKGSCSKCKTILPETILNDDDFKSLKKVFFDLVIVGKDVFRKSTPQELANFNRFIAEKKNYDVIIDGLNVAGTGGFKKPLGAYSGLLASVVEHYANQRKQVLVLGRTHMRKWPHFGRIQQNARVFLTQNLSQDDPYLLYCALNSGQGAIIVSRDLMRGHLYLLKEPYLKQLFKRWLSISQHKLLVDKKRDGKMSVQIPPKFIQSAQKCGNVWHLPCKNENEDKSLGNNKNNQGVHTGPTLWLCIEL